GLRFLRNVKNKGSQELAVRARGLLMMSRFDEGIETISVRDAVLSDEKVTSDTYAEAAMSLMDADVEVRHKFISYWLENESPSDAMLACVFLNFAIVAGHKPVDLAELLPEDSFPLTRAWLHINTIVSENAEPDVDLIESTLNAEYEEAFDQALADLLGISLLVDDLLDTERSIEDWLNGLMDLVKEFTPQQCAFFYDRTMGLKLAVAAEPEHSDLRVGITRLRESILVKLPAEAIERVESMEGRLMQHFVVKHSLTDED
ncbi:MAG: hypothetical protein AAF483_23830, partial [Planctomycetota bacterium]